MGKNRLCYLATLIGALVFHMYYTEWFSWFFLILVAVLPVFSLVLSLPGLLTARLHLDAPRTALRGQNAAAELRLTASLPAVRCRVRLFTPKKEKIWKRSSHFLIPGGKLSLKIPAEHCGYQELRLRRARVLDCLGLFSFPIRLPGSVGTEILPVPTPPEALPDVTRLLSPPLRPKAGGGFSEIHELREYRPGDAMRDVHWKLSAKTDSLIVREPQEEVLTQALLTLRLEGPGAEADDCLDQLRFLSPWLLERGIPHTVLCFCGAEEAVSASILGEEDLNTLLSQLVRRLPSLEPWSEENRATVPSGGWLYPIHPRKKEAAE